jgi:PAS domain S-box-containing protein
MQILYVGIDDPLDWSRRQILSSAGYVVMEACDSCQAEAALIKGVRLAIVSNLLNKQERDEVATRIATQSPDTLCLYFAARDLPLRRGEILPRQLTPSEFLKVVGSALMRQHQHPEVQGKYFAYVDYRRRYTHVSDGVCELTGFRREEILGQSIEWLTYGDPSTVPQQFHEYLQTKKMNGSYTLRTKQGGPIQVNYEATVLPDGCLCSQLQPQ